MNTYIISTSHNGHKHHNYNRNSPNSNYNTFHNDSTDVQQRHKSKQHICPQRFICHCRLIRTPASTNKCYTKSSNAGKCTSPHTTTTSTTSTASSHGFHSLVHRPRIHQYDAESHRQHHSGSTNASTSSSTTKSQTIRIFHTLR